VLWPLVAMVFAGYLQRELNRAIGKRVGAGLGAAMHVPRLMQAVAAGGAAYLLLDRPWEHWGASVEEARAPLPGDDVVPHATGDVTQAVTIGAPPEAVWPWLAQMGSGRAGWYTYPWIEGGHPDPDRIHSQYQHITEGDLIPDSPDATITWTVAAAEKPRLLVYATARRLWTQRNVNPDGPGTATWYRGSWAFVLRPADAGCTRLIVRWRHQLVAAHPGLDPVTQFALLAGHAFMGRKQLRGIRQRAQNAAQLASGPSALTDGHSPPQAGGPERLSPVDAANMRVERRGLPMHVAAIGVVDGTFLLDAAGRLRLEEVRADVERRLHLAPRLRQVLLRPRPGLGAPAWADDARFDIRRHVRARPVPAPGDEAAFLAVCSELNQPLLDRSRPLWELWLLPRLADGNVGMLFRLHHAVADGIAAIALMGALFEATPGAPPPPAPPWRPKPAPGAWQLFTSNWHQHAEALAAAGSRLRHPAAIMHFPGPRTRQLRLALGEGLAPRVSWNRPAGMRRRLLLVRADLAGAKAVAHAHGGTVNDVVLAAVAGGARQLLAGRGELRPGMVLKATVAAAARDPGDLAPTGNRAAIMLVPLPVSEPGPARRLAQIAGLTRARKHYPPYQPAGRLAQHAMIWAMPRQRLANLFTSNLPGPSRPMYPAGARVLGLFQVGVVQGNVTVAVGVLSYAGQLNFTVLGDADAVPDLKTFADGVCEVLTRLGATAGRMP
jgi:diacylglycerol O-acyltransferase